MYNCNIQAYKGSRSAGIKVFDHSVYLSDTDLRALEQSIWEHFDCNLVPNGTLKRAKEIVNAAFTLQLKEGNVMFFGEDSFGDRKCIHLDIHFDIATISIEQADEKEERNV